MQPTPGDAGHGTDSLRPELAGASRCWRGEMLVVIALEVVVRDRRDDPRSAQPLIGKSGSISVLISRIGQVGFAAGENRKLTGVELRPDGLIRLERETGWTVLDPSAVVAVVWHGDTENPPGPAPLTARPRARTPASVTDADRSLPAADSGRLRCARSCRGPSPR
jgi:hypothetical protein